MPALFRTDTGPARSVSHRLVLGLVLGVVVLLAAACGGGDPGPIADAETSNGFTLTLRSEGDLWYDVTESTDGGTTWEAKAPERYLPGTELGIAAEEKSRTARITSDTAGDPGAEGGAIVESPYTQTTEICSTDGNTCWRAVLAPEDRTDTDEVAWTGIERSDNAGTTWQTDFRVAQGRERFAPEGYPTIVDMARVNVRGKQTIVAVTAEHGALRSSTPGEWEQTDILHWSAPDLNGSWMLAWPELTAIAIASALALAVLFTIMFTLTRRAHEQVGQSLLSIIATLAVVPMAYYATQPILEWIDGTIVDRADAIADAQSAATLWALIALVVVVVLSLALRYRWSRRLGALPFPDTPA